MLDLRCRRSYFPFQGLGHDGTWPDTGTGTEPDTCDLRSSPLRGQDTLRVLRIADPMRKPSALFRFLYRLIRRDLGPDPDTLRVFRDSGLEYQVVLTRQQERPLNIPSDRNLNMKRALPSLDSFYKLLSFLFFSNSKRYKRKQSLLIRNLFRIHLL